MKNKYVVTLWQNMYDYDGLTCNFFVIGTFDNLGNAKVFVNDKSQNEMDDQLKKNNGWGIMEVGEKTQSITGEGVNKNNKIVYSHESKTGDGTGYNSAYNFYEVIEVPEETIIDKHLFNTADCEWEVSDYFDKKGN